MVHDDYKQMLPVRALSALDAADSVALNEHLLVCAECRRELETWEATAASISLGVTPMEPSATVRERILQQIREEGRSRAAEDTDARVVPFVSRSPAMSYGLIAAGIVCTLLIGWIALLARQNRIARTEVARLTEHTKRIEAQLTREHEIVSILTGPESKRTPLSGTTSAPGAYAMLAYNQKGQAVLLTEGLPAAPAGKGYQLWFIIANKPVPGQVFNTDSSGKGTMRDQMPGGVDDKAVFAITMENSTGAQSPTTPILLRSEL